MGGGSGQTRTEDVAIRISKNSLSYKDVLCTNECINIDKNESAFCAEQGVSLG